MERIYMRYFVLPGLVVVIFSCALTGCQSQSSSGSLYGSSSAFAASSGVQIVLASGALQKCLGISPGSDRMTRSAATQPYCKQLLGTSIYDQAGARFQAGDHAGAAQIVSKAARLFAASASQGWTKGQFALARAYQFGIGVAQNRQTAIAWYQKAAAQGNAKADYWAKWLRDPTNNIGFRNDTEHNAVIAGKLRFGTNLMGGDPAGVTFHSSGQRAMWLMGQKGRLDKEEAEVFRDIRRREYADCTQAGRDNCGAGRF
jgi:hypothetical protein